MKVYLHPIAKKYFERLNEPDKSYVKAALSDLEQEPPKGDIKPIVGQPGCFRGRKGNFRYLFEIENNVILVTHIVPRGQAYKKKNRRKK